MASLGMLTGNLSHVVKRTKTTTNSLTIIDIQDNVIV